MTGTAQQVVDAQNKPKGEEEPKVDPKVKKRNDDFLAKIDVCKSYKQKLILNWATNIDFRRGKPFTSQSDDDAVAVNLDWSYTKSKQASLYSQNPKIRVNHPPETDLPWVAAYERKLNDLMLAGGLESAMDECMPDCINAAGFGAVMVSYEAITEDKQVPKMDMSMLPPEVAAEALKTGMLNGQKLEMDTIPEVKDKRYIVERFSPSDYLFPLSFAASNFDKAPWQGRSGRINWTEAVQRFKLKEKDKAKILGDDRTTLDKLTNDIDKERETTDIVSFDEIFFKEFQFDAEAKSYSTIHHLVFVTGLKEPVIDEPWKGQKIDPATGAITGSLKSPIRVLTLTYISDETLPPSDTAIGRPQVNEINKSRTQMIKQRERSLPVRWFDVNRVDPTIQQALMRGTWQNMIPVQGEGSRILGEVARAVMPPEDFTFDNIAKSDLTNSWTIGPNQMGSGADVETKGESTEISSNFQTRVGRERAKVAAFVVGIAEVLGGLMCLFEDHASFGEGFDPAFSAQLQYSILADSTVLVDSNQRLERLNTFVNVYAKTGFVSLEPVLKEIATLTGLDPNLVIKAPEPPPPPEPNVSLRLSGAEDLMNSLVLAFILGKGQAPTAELIEQAKALIQSAVTPPPPPAPPQVGPDGQPIPAGQEGLPPGVGPDGQPIAPQEAPPVPVGEAYPDATVLPKITKRSDDPSLGGKEE